MALPAVAYVPLAGLVVLPAVVLVQHRRDKLSRWRLALASSAWLILLSNVVLALSDSGVLADDTGLWPAVTLGAGLGGTVGFGLAAWFWVGRDDRRERGVGRSV